MSQLKHPNCTMSSTLDFLVFQEDIGLFSLIFPSGLQQAYGHRTWYITKF